MNDKVVAEIFKPHPLLSLFPRVPYKRKPGRPKISEQEKVENWLKKGGSPKQEARWRRRALGVIEDMETTMEEY